MKKLLSAVLCAALIITALPCAYAVTVREALDAYTWVISIPHTKTVNVPADMKVRESGAANTYTDGPVVKNENPIATAYDFNTEIDMDNVRTSFENWMAIARAENTSDADYQSRIDNLRVKGQFVVSITYPNELVVNAQDTSATAGMRGFTSIVKDDLGNVLSTNDLSASSPVFVCSNRVVTPGADTTNITITIDIENAGNDYVVASELEANLDTYLADLALEMTGIVPSTHNTSSEPYYTVNGELSGYTYIYDVVSSVEDHIGTINYNVHQDGSATTENIVSAAIQVVMPSGSGTNVAVPTKPSAEKVTLEFVSEGDVHHAVTKANKVTVNVDEVEKPTREGYAFVGWFADEGYSIPVSGELEVTENTTIYAKWVNVTVPDGLNGDDRFAYIIGYPDGDVRPNANITREEIATIYYRLMTDEKRHELYTEENSFTDVEADRWSNEEISTVANGKYIIGDPDGTFRPEDAITRAEFVTIASRFLEDTDKEAYKRFNDIKDHWAEDAILSVANQEWITGYEDGSFRPDEYITRAEAMTIFNRILAHYVNAESLIDGVKHWPDNKEGAWYYYEVLSATNSRTFTFQADGYSEKWTEIVPNPDWSVIK